MQRIRVLRQRERDLYPAPMKESMAAGIAALWEMGVDAQEMARLLDRLHVELVFTAHPTEARRRTVLSKLRRISHALHELELRDLYRILPRGQGTQTILTYVQEIVAQELLVAHTPQPGSPIPPDVAANHVAAATMALIKWWLDHDMPYALPKWASSTANSSSAPLNPSPSLGIRLNSQFLLESFIFSSQSFSILEVDGPDWPPT